MMKIARKLKDLEKTFHGSADLRKEAEQNADRDELLKQGERLERPADQLQLTDKELDEEFTRILNANNPRAPQNTARFLNKERIYKVIPNMDHLVSHFAMDGHLMFKEESDDADQGGTAKENTATEPAAANTKQDMNTSSDDAKESEEAALQQVEDGSTRPTATAAAKNQFNTSERAAQSFNYPSREAAVSTEPPPQSTFSGAVTQWSIYDAYREDIDAKEKAAKERAKASQAASKSHQHTGNAQDTLLLPASLPLSKSLVATGPIDPSAPQTPLGTTPLLAQNFRVLERMANLNTYDDIAMDYQYWHDAGDDFRDGKGVLLPLWRFSGLANAGASKMTTGLCWSHQYADFFAVGYGSYDFVRQGVAGAPTGFLSAHAAGAGHAGGAHPAGNSGPATTTTTTTTTTTSGPTSGSGGSGQGNSNASSNNNNNSNNSSGGAAANNNSSSSSSNATHVNSGSSVHGHNVTGNAGGSNAGHHGAASGGGNAKIEEKTASGGGQVLCCSLKNPSHPEIVYQTPCGVMSLDFSKEHKTLLAVGLYDGTVRVYNLALKQRTRPIYDSAYDLQKHTEPVWQVIWQPDDIDGNPNFISVSSDGRVTTCTLLKNTILHNDIISLRVDTPALITPDEQIGSLLKPTIAQTLAVVPPRSLSPVKGGGHGAMAAAAAFGDIGADGALLAGTCCDFNKDMSTVFVVGTDEGRIMKCSLTYHSNYLVNFDGHEMGVYAIRYNPFYSRIFISASADWTVKVWHEDRPACLLTFDLGSSVGDVAWSPYSSTTFAAVSADGKVFVFDLSVNKTDPICEQQVVTKSRLTHLAFNPNYRGAVAPDDAAAAVNTQSHLAQSPPVLLVSDDRGAVTCVKISPNLCKTRRQGDDDEQSSRVEKIVRHLIGETDEPALLR